MTKGKTTNNGSQKHYTENEGLSKINKGTHRLVKQLISTGKNTSTGKGTHSVHIVTYKNVINILWKGLILCHFHHFLNEGLSKINKGTHRLVKEHISTGKGTHRLVKEHIRYTL